MIILKRKYCLTVCSFSPFMPSLDASFARVYNATCLWLLMTTAALHSTILLTHLSTVMNHLYSGFLFACVYIHASVGVCGSEVPKQPQGCPFLCIWGNYLYLLWKHQARWNREESGNCEVHRCFLFVWEARGWRWPRSIMVFVELDFNILMTLLHFSSHFFIQSQLLLLC